MKDFANRGRRRRWGRARNESDASELFFSSQGGGRREHKTAQLCRQVFWALSLALGECGDDVLRDLVLHDVLPAPDASRLLARVGFSSAGAQRSAAEVYERLAQASGFLRRQVAAAITRKRAPELSFALIASGEAMP
jgi:ribosome-binding factor A